MLYKDNKCVEKKQQQKIIIPLNWVWNVIYYFLLKRYGSRYCVLYVIALRAVREQVCAADDGKTGKNKKLNNYGYYCIL